MNDLIQSLQQQLEEWLLHVPHVNRLVVAFSGGLDSTVLLHACAALREQRGSPLDGASERTLEALHVDHGLSPRAPEWASHCRRQCIDLNVPLLCQAARVAAMPDDMLQGSAKVPEARARDARYAAFTRYLDKHSALLMAHHQDDQAETVLLRLLRGAGPAGLAGMPARRSLGAGQLWRPLLEHPRSVLEDHARQYGLSWVEDVSNADTRMDRNYLRHQILPLIGERWPDWRQSWQLSAQHCAEAADLVSGLARKDRAAIQAGPVPFTSARQCVDGRALIALPPERQRNVLRHWLQRETGAPVGARLLSRVLREVLPARADAAPEVPLAGHRLRRHRHALVVCRELPPFSRDWQEIWRPEKNGEVLVLPGNGRLVARSTAPGGVPSGTTVTLRYRRRGERCQLPGRPERALSRVLQEQGVPVWWRDRLPLVTVSNEVIWIPGVGPSGPASAMQHSGWAFDWYPPDREREPGHCGG
ncbi:MAG: tRNA lysidine(34) synthetase TilS [Pseudohongiellaceae bacterium]